MTLLRDYQEDICTRVRKALAKHRSVMMQMPMGTGKSVVLASLVREYLDPNLNEGCRVLIVAHRMELIEQMGEHLERYGMDYGVIAGGKRTKVTKPVVVASIQTLSAQLNRLSATLSPTFVLIDEAHHAVAKTYRLLWEAWPKARFLGLTATPYRLSGEGFTDLFDVLVDSWTVKRFIAEGWLSAFDYYSIRPESDEQQLIDNLKRRGADGDFQMKELHETLDVAPCIEHLFDSFERHAYDKKGIVYAIDIAHAEHIAAYYREQGVHALALSAKTPMGVRKEAVERFKTTREAGGLQVLVSVDLFSEGFDCPDVEFIQLARPTLSLAKYLQMVGRGLRPCKGKLCCTIIDNVGLYRNFGLPSGERDWGYHFVGRNLNPGLDPDMEHHLGLHAYNGSIREEGDADLVKIVGHEGMASRFANLGKAGFERKKQGKVWRWVDTMTGITFERHPLVVDFKGVEMMTDDGLTFYPRIRSKWVDGKSGINRKALETQVGDGFGWMRRYVSLRDPDKVYELHEVKSNGMRVYKDEADRTYFQQDLDSPLVSKEEAGGMKAFMEMCDERLEEWKKKVWKRRRDGSTEPLYEEEPIVRYRGFVKLLYDGDLVYIMNIHEERCIAYHNWEIRADDGICTIGNKLYLRSDKDGKALWIRKRSGDFQMFVVNEPMVEDYRKEPLPLDAQMLIINKYGKEVEVKQIKGEDD